MDLQTTPARQLDHVVRHLRNSAVLALCACALMMAAAKPTAEPRSSSGHHGVELNGFKLNGFKLNTVRLNGSAPSTTIADMAGEADLVAGSADLVGITLPNGDRLTK